MIIEIHTHAGPVNGGMIGHLESELSRLHRLLPRLSRAEVHLRTDPGEMPHRQYVCSIGIEAYGNDFHTVVHHEDWHQAIDEALAITEGKVREIALADRQPPDELLSTVKV
jgi:ribosome-associated translation inhibitor RaiA